MVARPPLRSSLGLALFLAVLWGGGAFWKSWQSEQLGKEVARLAQPGDIRMISSETCVYCEKARAWFTAHQVPFAECLVERDSDCAAAYGALQAPGTPLLLVRGRAQLGFSPTRIVQALR
jgi:glutaredoxin